MFGGVSVGKKSDFRKQKRIDEFTYFLKCIGLQLLLSQTVGHQNVWLGKIIFDKLFLPC